MFTIIVTVMLAVLVLALALYGHVAGRAGRYAGLGSGLAMVPSIAQLPILQACSPASHSYCQRGHVPAVRSAMSSVKGPRPPPWTGHRPMRPGIAFKADRITREQTMPVRRAAWDDERSGIESLFYDTLSV